MSMSTLQSWNLVALLILLVLGGVWLSIELQTLRMQREAERLQAINRHPSVVGGRSVSPKEGSTRGSEHE